MCNLRCQPLVGNLKVTVTTSQPISLSLVVCKQPRSQSHPNTHKNFHWFLKAAAAFLFVQKEWHTLESKEFDATDLLLASSPLFAVNATYAFGSLRFGMRSNQLNSLQTTKIFTLVELRKKPIYYIDHLASIRMPLIRVGSPCGTRHVPP